MINWHLVAITITFYMLIANLADFAYFLTVAPPRKAYPIGWLALLATVFFLLITWNEW